MCSVFSKVEFLPGNDVETQLSRFTQLTQFTQLTRFTQLTQFTQLIQVVLNNSIFRTMKIMWLPCTMVCGNTNVDGA